MKNLKRIKKRSYFFLISFLFLLGLVSLRTLKKIDLIYQILDLQAVKPKEKNNLVKKTKQLSLKNNSNFKDSDQKNYKKHTNQKNDSYKKDDQKKFNFNENNSIKGEDSNSKKIKKIRDLKLSLRQIVDDIFLYLFL